MIAAPICMFCRRLHPDNPDRPLPSPRRGRIDGLETPFMTCDAYPDGIPKVILESRHDHRRPRRGDHGLQYLGDDAVAGEIIEAVNS